MGCLVAERETDKEVIAKNFNTKVKYLKTMDVKDSKRNLVGERA